MNNDINRGFKKKIEIDERDYINKPDYRDEINYYYFQAKYQLQDGKITENGKENGRAYVKIKNNEGKVIKLYEVSKEESLFHNIKYFKDGSFYINMDSRSLNRKFVDIEKGYEVVLSNNLKSIVQDPTVYGTYNYYTYKSITSELFDAFNHTVDINLWKKHGSGPDDWTTKEQREAAYNLAIKMSSAPFVSDPLFKYYIESRKIKRVTPETYKKYVKEMPNLGN